MPAPVTVTAPRQLPRPATDAPAEAYGPIDRPRWQQLLNRVTGWVEDAAGAWEVSIASAATISVGPVGRLYAVRGHVAEITTVGTFDLSTMGTQPTGSQVRIDRVVARLDRAKGTVTAEVLVGTPAASGSAAAPSITRSSTVWEASLATVRRVGTAPLSIDPSDLTDTRSPAPEGAAPPVSSRLASYASAAQRDAANPSPLDGLIGYREDVDVADLYRAGGWTSLITLDRTRAAPFASAAARAAAWPNPPDGALVYLEDVDQFHGYKNGAWGEVGGVAPIGMDGLDAATFTPKSGGVSDNFSATTLDAAWTASVSPAAVSLGGQPGNRYDLTTRPGSLLFQGTNSGLMNVGRPLTTALNDSIVVAVDMPDSPHHTGQWVAGFQIQGNSTFDLNPKAGLRIATDSGSHPIISTVLNSSTFQTSTRNSNLPRRASRNYLRIVRGASDWYYLYISGDGRAWYPLGGAQLTSVTHFFLYAGFSNSAGSSDGQLGSPIVGFPWIRHVANGHNLDPWPLAY